MHSLFAKMGNKLGNEKVILEAQVQLDEAHLNDGKPIAPIPIGDDGSEILIRVDPKTETVVFEARIKPDPSVR